MQEWWSAISGLEQTLWVLAIVFSLLFLLQAIFTLMGSGDSSEPNSPGESALDSDFQGGASIDQADAAGDFISDFSDTNWQYFTVRNMVSFFTGFSWAGLACLKYGLGLAGIIFTGILVGLFFVGVTIALMSSMMKLESRGNLTLQSALGKEASVSILIPAARKGKGKIILTMQERMVELEAETEGQDLARGERVFVIRRIDGQTVLVGKHL